MRPNYSDHRERARARRRIQPLSRDIPPPPTTLVAGKAPIPVPEAESALSVAFSESQANGWFCFSVASDRGCDPAASPCCAKQSPTKAVGLREFRLAIGARLFCALCSAKALIARGCFYARANRFCRLPHSTNHISIPACKQLPAKKIKRTRLLDTGSPRAPADV